MNWARFVGLLVFASVVIHASAFLSVVVVDFPVERAVLTMQGWAIIALLCYLIARQS